MEKMEQKDSNELISGYLTGQLSNEQLGELAAWLKADKRNKQYFDSMRELWSAASIAFPAQPYNRDSAYRLFLSRIHTKMSAKPAKSAKPNYFRLVRVAAAVLTGFLLGAFYMVQPRQTDLTPLRASSSYDIMVPHGSRNQITLTDGTSVWLNAGSRLRYAADFGQTSREVYLEGEGYFDVARDTTKLFIVKTDKLNVTALGTSFNVKAYPGEDNIETVLVTGKVSIGDVVLSPHEKLIYSRKENKSVIERTKSATSVVTTQNASLPSTAKIVETRIDPAIYTSWKDELWRIEAETLGSFAVKLERRYDVKIQFADKGVQSMSINAIIKDESLEQVLRFLQLTIPVDFAINGKTVVLKENKYLKEKYRKFYKQN